MNPPVSPRPEAGVLCAAPRVEARRARLRHLDGPFETRARVNPSATGVRRCGAPPLVTFIFLSIYIFVYRDR